MTYDIYLHEKTYEFLQALPEDEDAALLHELRALRDDPFRSTDFTEQTDEGAIDGVLVAQYAIMYHVDHPVKRIRVVDITYADRV